MSNLNVRNARTAAASPGKRAARGKQENGFGVTEHSCLEASAPTAALSALPVVGPAWDGAVVGPGVGGLGFVTAPWLGALVGLSVLGGTCVGALVEDIG